MIDDKIKEQDFLLQSLEQNLKWLSEHKIQAENEKISTLEAEMKNSAQFFLQKEKAKINQLEAIYQILNPEETLKRGYSLTSQNGKIIKSIKDFNPETEITTKLSDGIIKSKTKV